MINYLEVKILEGTPYCWVLEYRYDKSRLEDIKSNEIVDSLRTWKMYTKKTYKTIDRAVNAYRSIKALGHDRGLEFRLVPLYSDYKKK